MAAQPADPRRAIVAFAVAKALTAGALLAGIWLYFTPLHPWSYLVYTDRQAGALLAFINWDGQHYLRLALGGYPQPADPSTAFYPLFPGLIAGAMRLGLAPIAAGLAVVTLCSLAGLLLLERLLPRDEPAPSSLWLLACFPTAFYLSVVYAEALFLAAFFGLLWALRERRRAGWALACAALLPVTRGQGLWLLVPLAAAAAALAWGPARPGAPQGRCLAAAALGYAIGVAAYFGFFWWQYADPLAGIRAQALFVFKNELGHLFDPVRFVDFLLRPPQRFLDTTNSGLDKLMMAVVLATAVGMLRCRDAFLLAAWACFGLLPALMGEGGSYARHALLAWACFVPAVGPSLSPAAKWSVIVPAFALQAWLAFLFGANRWVG